MDCITVIWVNRDEPERQNYRKIFWARGLGHESVPSLATQT